MKRVLIVVVSIAAVGVCRGAVIDLLENPDALPSDKPATVQINVLASVDDRPQTAQISLEAVEFDTTLNLVNYHQLSPVTMTWAALNGETITLSNLHSVLDPSGSFSGAFTDFGAPSTFTATFTFPAFAPTMFGNVLFSGSVSGSATDGTAVPNGVSYTPTGGNPGVFRYELFDTTSALLATFFHDPGAAFPAGPPNTHTTGPFDNSGSPLLVAAGPNGVGTVVVTASFTGSGGTDQYAFTGRWDVIPEPSSFGLALSGLLGLAAFAWKRRK
jgi:hypothetical protein